MRILLITPSFFGYEGEIADEFRAQGHAVDLLDERPSNRAWARAAIRVAPGLVRRQVSRYYDTLVGRLRSQQYDALIVIKGEVVPPRFLEVFIERNPMAARAYYTFDSISNSPQGRRILRYFQHRFTFDPVDAATHEGFEYKPLFYSPHCSFTSAARQIDVAFVGTLHGDRYEFAKAVTSRIPHDRVLLFFYTPAAWYFWLRKATSKHVRPVRRGEVSTVPMSRADTVALTQRSRVMIDLQRAGQAGLTMRTFETLATGTALVTANEAIKNEPFYDPRRILVVPRSPAEIDPDSVRAFVQQADTAMMPDSIERYMLSRWVSHFAEVLGE